MVVSEGFAASGTFDDHPAAFQRLYHVGAWALSQISPGSQKARQAEAAVVVFADAAGKTYASLWGHDGNRH